MDEVEFVSGKILIMGRINLQQEQIPTIAMYRM